MAVSTTPIEVDNNFQGGLTLASSGVKNGLIAAIDLGLVDKPNAIEILLLVKEAIQQLIDTMED